MQTAPQSLDADGYGVVPTLVPPKLLKPALAATDALRDAGLRNPLDAVPELRAVARCDAISELVDDLLGSRAVLTRAILFDKTPERNWPVPPHRDTTVAVAERHEVEGYGPWSVKEGVVHVRPPDAVLAEMWTLRIALDSAPESNGALRVQPGSHLVESSGADWVTLACEPGDVVLMRPLLMHASSRAASPTRRRVLHLEWAPGPLPAPLAWMPF